MRALLVLALGCHDPAPAPRRRRRHAPLRQISSTRRSRRSRIWGYLDATTGELLVIWHTIEG